MPAHDRALARHQRAYRSLLVLYPPGFRRDWGPAMVQLLGDQLRHRSGRVVGVRVWLRTLDDLLTSVPRQQWERSTHQTTSVLFLIVANTVFLLGALLVLAGTAMGLGQLWQRTHHRERHS